LRAAESGGAASAGVVGRSIKFRAVVIDHPAADVVVGRSVKFRAVIVDRPAAIVRVRVK